MASPLQIEQALNNVRDQKGFIQELLIGALGWPVPDAVEQIDEIAYDWTSEDLRATGLDDKVVGGKAFQVQLNNNQAWGIFVLEFHKRDALVSGRGMTVPLRKVLRGLVASPRRRADLPAFSRPNLLFLCTHGYRDYRFAYFKTPPQGSNAAPLATFGWEADNQARRTVCEFNLPDLSWPGTGVSPADWTTRWAKAFDLEKVTKAFFEQYRVVFEKVEGLIKGISDKEQLRLYRQRLFNRLMFIAFIQKKGWLKIEGMEHNNYLKGLWDRHQSKKGGEGNFCNDRLRRLFFHALNTPNDVNQVTLGRQGFGGRVGLLQQTIGEVPYLNGGLFEMSEDGTDNEDRIGKIVVPDEAIHTVLHELFAKFNFTVVENTPLDIEVAVDPEMLGKVFEELVTGRHESGSYYTPKFVVSFMCREAIKGYLRTRIPAESPAAIAALVDDHNPSSIANGEAVLGALRTVRVCDPACGSGAYLLGMMHELLDLRACLFASNSKLDTKSVYERKLEIIQTNLYGVDIDPFAINIARLRLWLSLSVEYDGNDPPPLPNLDFKIEAGDSLSAPDPSGSGQLALHRELVEQFAARKREFLTSHGRRKKELRAEIDALRDKLRQWAAARGDTDGFDWTVEFAEVFVGETFETTMGGHFGFAADARKQLEFKESRKIKPGGFDIVLANPPYVNSREMAKTNPRLRKIISSSYSMARGSWDLYIAFFERGFSLLASDGVLAFITPDKWISKPFGDELRRQTTDRIASILRGGRRIFETVNVDAIVSIFTKRPCDQIGIYELGAGGVEFKGAVRKEILKPPYAYDWLFSRHLGLLAKIEAHPHRLQELAVCENSCATDDAYRLRELIEELPVSSGGSHLPMINTGTIGKYVSKWGHRPMTYLGSKYQRPSVHKRRFLQAFPNSYGKKSIKRKLILKALNLLDACLDADGRIVPGIPTLIVASDNLEVLKLLLAIINCPLASFYIREKYPASSYNGATTFTKEMINDLPIPEISRSDRSKILRLVNRILDVKTLDPNADSSSEEREIGDVIANLYGLSPREKSLLMNRSASVMIPANPNRSRRRCGAFNDFI